MYDIIRIIISCFKVGVDNGKGGGYEKLVGDHALKLNGRTYHYIPKTGGSGGLEYFTFDALEALQQHGASMNKESKFGEHVKSSFLQQLFEELKCSNYLVQDCEQIGQELTRLNPTADQSSARQVMAQLNTLTSALDVAAITSDRTTGERTLTYKLKGNNKATCIPSSHSLMEPLSYPLLFPNGEDGWGTSTNRDLKFSDYLLSRMLMPEKAHGSIPEQLLYCQNKAKTHDLPVNRFQLMARLGQTYLVDMTSRAIDTRLNWQNKNKAHMFGNVFSDKTSNNDVDREHEGDGSGGGGGDNDGEGGADGHEQSYMDSSGKLKTEPTFLSQSLHGSKRHLKGLARNALAIVSELKAPTFFITATCNPMWPEIQEALLSGQSAFDRPDIVCRVFKQRLSAFLANLRAGKYFNGRIIYEISVIEYQHRGLPHAHIVIKIEGAPTSDEPELASDWVDANLTAKMPIITDASSAEDIKYAQLVVDHMTHKCAKAVNGCLDDNDHCKKGYHSNALLPRTIFDQKGFPKYQRLNEEDLKVVPHHREALLDWEGHLNWEWAGSTKAVLYLYKVSLFRFGY